MKATQNFSIKEKLAGKDMAKAALYSAKLRLKLPLWEAPLPLLTKLPVCPGGRSHAGLGAEVPNHFSPLYTMF